MNKTISIGLAGFSFIIEEHAYIKLSDYLKSLRNALEKDEADEVMHDIEIRIVEIFRECLNTHNREVINTADVEKIIDQLGTPETIEEQENAYFSDKIKNTDNNQTKQLFRDPTNRKIAGVCSGMASYFGMEITTMRLIWIGLFLALSILFGTSMLLLITYIILWISVPKAQTTTDFLKMKGKPIDFDNIKEESEKLTNKIGDFLGANSGSFTNIAKTILKIIMTALGLFFAIWAIMLVISFIAVLSGIIIGNSYIDEYTGSDLFYHYLNINILNWWAPISMIILIFVVGILLSINISIAMFSPKIKLRNSWIATGILFIALVITSIISLPHFVKDIGGESHTEESISINTASDTLFIGKNKVEIPAKFKKYGKYFTDNKKVFVATTPKVNIIHDNSNIPYLSIYKEGSGMRTIKINTPVKVIDNKILLPEYISYPFEELTRGYDVDYTLHLPHGMNVIKLNDSDNIRIEYKKDYYYDDDYHDEEDVF